LIDLTSGFITIDFSYAAMISSDQIAGMNVLAVAFVTADPVAHAASKAMIILLVG
jgi:hypothetical protein